MQYGKWTYECKGAECKKVSPTSPCLGPRSDTMAAQMSHGPPEPSHCPFQEYKSRPSRTKMLQNPKLQPKLTSKTVDNETTVTGIEAPAKKRRVEAEGAAKVDTDSDSSSSSSSSESDSSSSSDSDSSSDSSDSSSSSDSDNSSSDSSSSSSGSSSSSSDSDDGGEPSFYLADDE